MKTLIICILASATVAPISSLSVDEIRERIVTLSKQENTYRSRILHFQKLRERGTEEAIRAIGEMLWDDYVVESKETQEAILNAPGIDVYITFGPNSRIAAGELTALNLPGAPARRPGLGNVEEMRVWWKENESRIGELIAVQNPDVPAPPADRTGAVAGGADATGSASVVPFLLAIAMLAFLIILAIRRGYLRSPAAN